MIDGYRDMRLTITTNCETNPLYGDAVDSDLSHLPAMFQAATKSSMTNPTRA
jgi:hypothetical protein